MGGMEDSHPPVFLAQLLRLGASPTCVPGLWRGVRVCPGGVPSHWTVAFLAASEGSMFIQWGHVSRTTMDTFSARSDSASGAPFLGQPLVVLV